MMSQSETMKAALRYFDQVPIMPEHVRVLVQAGLDWHWHEMPARKLWTFLETFEKSQPKSLRPHRYTDSGCQKVSILLAAASRRGDNYEVCVSSLWLLFRRPRERDNRHEAKAHLAALMSDYGSAWIVTVCSDLADLDTMQFYTTHGDWHPTTNDPEIDLTPMRADLPRPPHGNRVPDRPVH
jgi:hypothetical protein